MATSETGSLSPEELLVHADWLRKLAYALVSDPDDAGDLVQDTMVAALSKPPSRPGPLRPWLAGVARNLARMQFRSTSRRSRREDETFRLAPSEEVGASALLERLEMQQRIAAKVHELDEPYRETILLRYYEGLSAAEIAKRIDTPAGTVRWRLKTGMDKLRSQLDEAHRGDRSAWALLVSPLSEVTEPTASVAAGGLKGTILMGTGWKIFIAAMILAVGLFAFGSYANWWGEPSGNSLKVDRSVEDLQLVQKSEPKVGGAMLLSFESIARSADPSGAIRLEGQVIGHNDDAVPGALVVINTVPSRTVTSDANGSFAFTGLIARNYALEAGSDDAHAGPVFTQLSADSEPLVLRLQAAGRVEVTVLGDADVPIVGAEVAVRSGMRWHGISDTEGRVVLDGIGAGQYFLRVAAQGYAPIQQRLLTEGDDVHPIIRMHRGTKVAGTVLDSSGKAVVGARITAESTSEPFPVVDLERGGVLSNERGEWQLAVVAKGAYRINARHPEYAPAATSPLNIDGVHERVGLAIVMSEPASVTGMVVGADGSPVSGAEIRVVSRGSVHWRTARQAYSDHAGHFSFVGLAANAVDIVASNRDGASDVYEAVLKPGAPAEVELRLTIAGTVAGTVVDSEGVEIPEAQVLVEPEMSTLERQREWQIRGQQVQVADAGGKFRFAGLPSGSYRLRAERPGAVSSVWLAEGVRVETGNNAVVVTINETGRARGKVLFPDGSSPSSFSIAVGASPSLPFATKDGSFSLAAPTGKRYLRVSGPDFAQKTLQVSIDVKSDLGTINVKRGRSISGRVLDESGVPVSGVQVVAGSILTGDGKKLFIEDESMNAKSTQSDEQGWYSLSGFGDASITIVCGNDAGGRSESIRLPPGNTSALVDLVLRETGSLSGVVTKNGVPVAETVVIANPAGANASNFFVVTGADGSYEFESLSPGEYGVYPMIGGGGMRPKDMFLRVAEVVTGAPSTLDIHIETGTGSVEISVVTSDGKAVPMAALFVIAAKVRGATMDALRDGSLMLQFRGRETPVAAYIRMVMEGAVTISDLSVGELSVCVQPLPVDPSNPMGAMALRGKMGTLPMKCESVVVGEGERKKISVEVPAEWMNQ